MASITIKNISTDSFQARVTGMYTALYKTVTWYIDGSEWDQEELATSDTSSNWITFGGLNPDTEYKITAEIYYETGTTDRVIEYVITESQSGGGYEPDMSSVYIQKMTPSDPTTQIAVRLRGLDTSYSEDDWRLTWYLHNPNLSGSTLVASDSENVAPGDSRSSIITFSGLTPKTTYNVECRIRYYVSGSLSTKWVYLDGVVTESQSSMRPDYFEWEAPKISGETFNITADEWCGLLNNINNVRVYKGYSEISSTSDPSAITRFYYPSKGDKMLASMYNQCIYAFENMGLLDYSSYRVLKGDPITADAINFLRDTINSVK